MRKKYEQERESNLKEIHFLKQDLAHYKTQLTERNKQIKTLMDQNHALEKQLKEKNDLQQRTNQELVVR